ncbi:MAG TPA: hypothetical protein VHK90_05805, partial [Thermoanaerobaculia bacterium]|nr:hypothetical protein [Thermoanaerobaculia bacterium]
PGSATPLPAADLPFQVIVHRANPVSSLSRSELSAIFMRRTRSWPGGAEIVPVEPFARSPLRERFSRAIHGKSVAFVIRYWQRVIFAGRGIPPQELPSDAAVLELVKNHRGAIGYIARQTPADDVKVIAVTP